jgi:hypothetical protein
VSPESIVGARDSRMSQGRFPLYADIISQKQKRVYNGVCGGLITVIVGEGVTPNLSPLQKGGHDSATPRSRVWRRFRV